MGIFVFSQRTAPPLCDEIRRIGNDLFVVWDAENIATDANLKAALEIARALCIRSRQAREQQTVDFAVIDKSILEIEKRVTNLDEIRKSADTIQSSSTKILERVRIDREALDKQLEILRGCLGDLKESLGAKQVDDC